jgi:enoyl-CoA hydratase
MDRIMSAQQSYADGKLLVRRRGDVAAITFNNPAKLNAMTLAMWQALGDVCTALAADDSLRVLTLEGGGDKAFVAGADISEFADIRSDAKSAARYGAAVERAERAVEDMPVPTLALLRGYCIGGGLGIAMRCDLRLARDDTRFAITPARIGLGYGYDGVASLFQRLGHATAADLLFSGRKISVDEALAKGVCDLVFPAATFQADSAAYVDQLAANAPLTIRAAKAALRLLALPADARDRSGVDAMVQTCFDSADYAEGQRAFAEKRQPVFRGR